MKEYVIYKNDKKPIIYEITYEHDDYLIITGINYRIQRKVKKYETEKAKEVDIDTKKTNFAFLNNKFRNKKYVLGTILHIDADKNYLDKCLELYKEMGIHAYSVLTNESDISKVASNINLEVEPDVVVITGHDYYNNEDKKALENYANTINFIKGMKEFKKKFPNSVYIVGACQSNFEALIANGANFASSPKRINVHIYDPAIIAIKVSTTAYNKIVNFDSLSNVIENLNDAYGGIETMGKMRILY